MQLKENYIKIRTATIAFCNHLEIEDFAIQVAKFASPAKWHLAHTTWFFETFILKEIDKNYLEFDANFNYLFNSYYNNVGSRVLQNNRGNMSRPSTNTVFEYRKHVDAKMLAIIDRITDQKIIDLIVLGLQHEQQHQELLVTDVKYMLGHNPLLPTFADTYNLVAHKNTAHTSIKIAAGVYTIGHQEKGFCYDNELGVHKVYVADFEIDNYLVTNRDFIDFIEAGGYADFNLWLDEGWSWIQDQKINAPMYWHKINNQWHYYTLAGLQKIDLDAVLCHISYFEANSFATFKNKRLPTEFEWEIAAKKLNWGLRWEWTNSAYLPYPGFVTANGAVGEYNGKFMSNKMVLRGASTATSANHSRHTYRNFFSATDRWQFTGIRLVK